MLCLSRVVRFPAFLSLTSPIQSDMRHECGTHPSHNLKGAVFSGPHQTKSVSEEKLLIIMLFGESEFGSELTGRICHS